MPNDDCDCRRSPMLATFHLTFVFFSFCSRLSKIIREITEGAPHKIVYQPIDQHKIGDIDGFLLSVSNPVQYKIKISSLTWKQTDHVHEPLIPIEWIGKKTYTARSEKQICQLVMMHLSFLSLVQFMEFLCKNAASLICHGPVIVEISLFALFKYTCTKRSTQAHALIITIILIEKKKKQLNMGRALSKIRLSFLSTCVNNLFRALNDEPFETRDGELLSHWRKNNMFRPDKELASNLWFFFPSFSWLSIVQRARAIRTMAGAGLMNCAGFALVLNWRERQSVLRDAFFLVLCPWSHVCVCVFATCHRREKEQVGKKERKR